MDGVALIGAKNSVMPLHRHNSSHEVIYVLVGSAGFRLADKEFALEGGDHASVPPSTVHGFGFSSHRTRLLSWTFGDNATVMYATLGLPTDSVICSTRSELRDWKQPLPDADVEFLSD